MITYKRIDTDDTPNMKKKYFKQSTKKGNRKENIEFCNKVILMQIT